MYLIVLNYITVREIVSLLNDLELSDTQFLCSKEKFGWKEIKHSAKDFSTLKKFNLMDGRIITHQKEAIKRSIKFIVMIISRAP